MKNTILLFVIIFSLALAGCGPDKQKDNAPNLSQLEPIKVTIQLPEKIESGQEVSIKATVKQGSKPVENAEEVEFEVWDINSEAVHEKIEGEHVGNGVYEVNKTFEEDGYYSVIAHVTAEGMHTMPEQEFTVGDPPQEDQQAVESEHEHASEHSDSSEKKNHHGHSLDIKLLSAETINANTDEILTAEIKEGDHPLTDANIQFEIWKENTGENDKQWINAKETTDGVYEIQTKFGDAGSYLITVHVKKGELHDHFEKLITVK
jgi:hypothetical protein